MRFVVLAAIGWVVTSAASAHAQAGGGGSTAPTSSGTIYDTDREFFPDPADRTHIRMEVAQHLISAYQAEHGAFPPSLDAAIFADPRGRLPISIERDGWSNPFAYRLVGASYELRSAGPDGVIGSTDDVVVRGDETRLPPRGSR